MVNGLTKTVTHMADAAEQIMLRNQLTNYDVSYLVSHQANKRIIDATAKRMGIVEEKVLKCFVPPCGKVTVTQADDGMSRKSQLIVQIVKTVHCTFVQ